MYNTFSKLFTVYLKINIFQQQRSAITKTTSLKFSQNTSCSITILEEGGETKRLPSRSSKLMIWRPGKSLGEHGTWPSMQTTTKVFMYSAIILTNVCKCLPMWSWVYCVTRCHKVLLNPVKFCSVNCLFLKKYWEKVKHLMPIH